MSNLFAYNSATLRYVHDTTSGEFINVGVVLHSPEARFVNASCRLTYGRLSKMFPGVNTEHFKATMRHIQSRFEGLAERARWELSFSPLDSFQSMLRHVVPLDDGSLQWSSISAGITENPSSELEKLFGRMVLRHDEQSRSQKTEEDVWRHFKATLESRHLLKFLEAKRIKTKDDEIEFQHTWKNSQLHCLEPVSFDLRSPDKIRDKAHRWLGRITSVYEEEKVKLYFLVGQPQTDKQSSRLVDAYQNALSILRKVPGSPVIVAEQDAEQFSEHFANEIKEHEVDFRLT